MDPRQVQPTSPSDDPERGDGASRKLIATIVLLGLMAGTAHLVSPPGHPFAVSWTHVLWLAGWALAIGLYVVLARAGCKAASGVWDASPARSGVVGPRPPAERQR
jgi:hypothetical protein